MTAAFDNMHQGFMLLDNQGRVTNFNPRLGEIIGYPPGVLRVGATARDLIDGSAALGHYPGASAEQAYEAWSGRLGAGRPRYHIGRSLDGRTIGIGYAPYGNGQWVLTYEDISARVDAETALAEQNEPTTRCGADQHAAWRLHV